MAELVSLHFERLLLATSEERLIKTAGAAELETVLRLANKRPML